MKLTRLSWVAALLSLALFSAACPAFPEISDADFQAAFEKFIRTDQGRRLISEALISQLRGGGGPPMPQRQEPTLDQMFANPVKVSAENRPVKGPQDAKVTIVEYSDFECPFCKRGADIMAEVMKAYPRDVKLVFKNLPLPFHQQALPAAKAAMAAWKQDKFWEMHDALFAEQRSISPEFALSQAEKLGLDTARFKQDMESSEILAMIDADKAEASRIGMNGTPGFVVGGILVFGARPVENFKTVIDRLLAAPPPAK